MKPIKLINRLILLWITVLTTSTICAQDYPANSYELSADGKTLIKWKGKEASIDMNIDSKLKLVTTIEKRAFRDNRTATSVAIGNAVTTIGRESFNRCNALTSVSIPKSVTTIGVDAFAETNSLKSINVATENATFLSENGVLYSKGKDKIIQYPIGKTLNAFSVPDGVKSIEESCFSNSKLSSVELPSTLTSIGANAFYGCRSLSSINLPAGLQYIYPYAFTSCARLQTVKIPSNIKRIGDAAFAACSSLKNFTMTGEGSNYTVENGILLSKDKSTLVSYPSGSNNTSYTVPVTIKTIQDGAFYVCKNLESLKMLPNSVTTIGNMAFPGNHKLKTITLPNSLKTVGSFAFAYCSKLNSVQVNVAEPTSISLSRGVFENSPISKAVLHVPKGSTNKYQTAAQWKDFGMITDTPLLNGVKKQDYEALVAIYNATDGSQWALNKGWMSDKNVSEWHGVAVEKGRVVRLNFGFRGNNMAGYIPSEVGNLTALRELVFYKNPKLSGEIPASIGNLKNLKVLGLAGNALSGKVPNSIGDLSNLNVLALWGNKLTGKPPIGKLNNLTRVFLDSNSFTGLPVLEHQERLTYIDVKNNNLDFSHLKNVVVKPKTFNYKPQANIGLDSKLEGNKLTLTSKDTKVNGNSYQWYRDDQKIADATKPSYIIPDKNTAEKGVYYCEITNSDFKGFSLRTNGYGVKKTLKNGIAPQDYNALVDFYNATNGDNWISKTNWKSEKDVSNWFGIKVEKGRVVELSVNRNNVSGTIPSSIGNLTKLKKIELYRNNIKGALPNEISNLKELELLSLGGNEITKVPNSINQLTNLKIIYLWENKLNSFPNIKTLTLLEVLDLGGNKTGVAPAGIESLTNLVRLRLDNMDLTEVPNIALSTKLEILRLNNNMVKDLPDLSSLTKLNRCDVRRNNLDFGSLENAKVKITATKGGYMYSPQSDIGVEKTEVLAANTSKTLQAASRGTNNTYQWYKDSKLLTGETNDTLNIAGFDSSKAGVYYCRIKNEKFPRLTLRTAKHMLILSGEGALLKDLQVNGNTVENFIANKHSYKIVLPSGTTTAPEVTATAYDTSSKITITPATKLPGETIVNVASKDGKITKKYTVSFTVLESVTGIAVNKTNLSLGINSWERLQVTFTPENASNKTVTWSSSDKNIATVDATGKITGKTAGNAVITVTSTDGNHKATCNVTVKDVNVAKIALNTDKLGLNQGDTQTLITKITPENATNKKVTWASSNINVASVDENGTITAVGVGTATITATTVNGNKAATVLVTVKKVEKDRGALIAFYNALGGKNWTKKTNWLSDKPISEWHGITAVDGQVTQIALSRNNLKGNLPKSIEKFEKLDRLIIWNNQISGNIPASISKLANLKLLDLYGNNLQGTIPNLTSLKNLNYIYLQNNKFHFADIESQYAKLSSKIRFYFLPQQNVGEIVSFDFTKDKTYTFTMPKIKGSQISYQWYKNDVAINGATNLTYTISKASKNDLGDYTCKATSKIVKGVDNNTYMLRNTIHLYGKVSDAEKNALIALYDSTNGDNWKNKTNWKTNKPVYKWYGVSLLGDKVSKINLENNGLTGTLPDNFNNYKDIEVINLGDNKLTGNIPNSMTVLNNLKRLDVYKNELTGDIPSNIGELSSLRILNIGRNKLTGDIPNNIGKLSSLTFLDVSRNKLTGSINSIKSLTNLTVLDVSNNDFTGSIPVSFQNLKKMKTFFVYSNKLTGDIPDIFKGMTNLQRLALGLTGTNQLTGNVNLSKNKTLWLLAFRGLKINSVDLRNGNNKFLTHRYFDNTPNLTCIYVDNVAYSNANWKEKDSKTHYVANEKECKNLSVEDYLVDDALFSIYPNPAKDVLNINSSEEVKSISVFNISGREVKRYKDSKQIDVSNLSSGIYIIQVITDKGVRTHKVIKN